MVISLTRPDASDNDISEPVAQISCTDCGHPSATRRRPALRLLATLRLWPREAKCFADVSDELEWLPECPCRNSVHRR